MAAGPGLLPLDMVVLNPLEPEHAPLSKPPRSNSLPALDSHIIEKSRSLSGARAEEAFKPKAALQFPASSTALPAEVLAKNGLSRAPFTASYN